MVAERDGLTEAGEHFGSVARRIGIGEVLPLVITAGDGRSRSAVETLERATTVEKEAIG
jgi:hypothetical protein